MSDATGASTPRKITPKFTSLEAGRAFAALMVVLFHCNETGRDAKYFGYEALPFFRGGYSGVEYFFVLSGFVMVVAHRKDLVSHSGTARFLWKRFQRLYPTLWVVVGVLIIAMVAVPALQWAGRLSTGDIVAAVTVIPYPRERVLSVEWTLRYEIVFYLLFAICIRWRRTGVVIWLAWCGIGLASIWLVPRGILGFFVAPYPLIFAAGMIVGFVFQRMSSRIAAISVMVGGIAYLMWLTRLFVPTAVPDKLPVDALSFGAGAVLILAGLASLEHLGKVTAPRFLSFLGAASYSIYLIHYPAMSILMKVAMKLRTRGLPDYVAIALILAASVGAGILFHLIVEKRLLKITKQFGDKYFQRASVRDKQ